MMRIPPADGLGAGTELKCSGRCNILAREDGEIMGSAGAFQAIIDRRELSVQAGNEIVMFPERLRVTTAVTRVRSRAWKTGCRVCVAASVAALATACTLVAPGLRPDVVELPKSTQSALESPVGESRDPSGPPLTDQTISVVSAGLLTGRVISPDGKPMARVKVAAYVANRSVFEGGGLVGNNAAGIISTNGSGLGADVGAPVFLRLLGLESSQNANPTGVLSTHTDDAGHFALGPPTSGLYNLEAVQSDSQKSWRGNIAFTSGLPADAGVLELAPTGHLSGTVLAADTRVRDFSDSVVYVPGSSYGARTDANGNYVISNLPTGLFSLRAHHADLGEAEMSGVRVVSNTTSLVPSFLLKVTEPVVERVLRIANGRQTDQSTDNGAPGTILAISGKHFGYRRGIRFEVRFSAATADRFERVSDDLIRVKVPTGALSGQALVVVGGLVSNAVPFNVIKAISLQSSQKLVNVGETVDLKSQVIAWDAGSGIIDKPNLDWSTATLTGTVDQDGLFRATTPGSASVTVSAGDLAPIAIEVVVLKSMVGGTDPSASPSPSQAPVPTQPLPTQPVPTQPPVPAPSSSPTPGLRLATIKALRTTDGALVVSTLEKRIRGDLNLQTVAATVSLGGSEVVFDTRTFVGSPTKRVMEGQYTLILGGNDYGSQSLTRYGDDFPPKGFYDPLRKLAIGRAGAQNFILKSTETGDVIYLAVKATTACGYFLDIKAELDGSRSPESLTGIFAPTFGSVAFPPSIGLPLSAPTPCPDPGPNVSGITSLQSVAGDLRVETTLAPIKGGGAALFPVAATVSIAGLPVAWDTRANFAGQQGGDVMAGGFSLKLRGSEFGECCFTSSPGGEIQLQGGVFIRHPAAQDYVVEGTASGDYLYVSIVANGQGGFYLDLKAALGPDHPLESVNGTFSTVVAPALDWLSRLIWPGPSRDLRAGC